MSWNLHMYTFLFEHIESVLPQYKQVLCTVKADMLNVDLLNVTLQVDLCFSGHHRENVQQA